MTKRTNDIFFQRKNEGVLHLVRLHGYQGWLDPYRERVHRFTYLTYISFRGAYLWYFLFCFFIFFFCKSFLEYFLLVSICSRTLQF